jgi:hypothetical protein
VAEIPDFLVTFEGGTTVRLNVEYEESLGETSEYGTTLSRSTSHTDEHSYTATEQSHWSVTLGFEYKFGGTDSGATVKGEGEGGHEWGSETADSFSDQETATSEYSRMQSDSRTRTESAATGFLSQGLRIQNTGTSTFQLSTLALTVLQWVPDVSGDFAGDFRAVATLLPEVNGITLAPGERTDVLQVDATDVNAELLKEFLAQPATLHYSAGTVELVDSRGHQLRLPHAERLPAHGGRVHRLRRGAHRALPGCDPTCSADPAASTWACAWATCCASCCTSPSTTRESSATSGELVLESVRDAGNESGQRRGLPPARDVDRAHHDRRAGGSRRELRGHRAARPRPHPARLTARTRTRTACSATRRACTARWTRARTPTPTRAHPQGDGLDDFFEIRTGWEVGPIVDPDLSPAESSYSVRSSPLSMDQDEDGLSDDAELAQKTDPRKPDTDGDGPHRPPRGGARPAAARARRRACTSTRRAARRRDRGRAGPARSPSCARPWPTPRRASRARTAATT